jgi:hypothetical protein
MKRALLSLVAVAVAFALPTLAHGQSTVSVSATVNPVITPGTPTALGFGAANPGVTLAISPLAAPGQGARGVLPVTHNTKFSVAGVITQLTGGGGTINGTYFCAFTATDGGTTGLDGTTATTSCSDSLQRTTTAGPTFIMIGGNVPIPAGATAGAYSGSIVFTFTPVAS